MSTLQIPLTPIHLFTRQIVPSWCSESLTQSLSKWFSSVYCMHFIKCSIKNIFECISFFPCFFLSFSLHSLSWACRSLHEHRKFFFKCFFVHSPVCQIIHSFLNGFQPNLYQHFSHVCSICHAIFRTFECI